MTLQERMQRGLFQLNDMLGTHDPWGYATYVDSATGKQAWTCPSGPRCTCDVHRKQRRIDPVYRKPAYGAVPS